MQVQPNTILARQQLQQAIRLRLCGFFTIRQTLFLFVAACSVKKAGAISAAQCPQEYDSYMFLIWLNDRNDEFTRRFNLRCAFVQFRASVMSGTEHFGGLCAERA
jgi:hypothetical protein